MLGNSFDLKSVILSPAPLGPPSQLAPPPGREPEAAPAAAKPEAAAKAEAAPTVGKTEAAKPRKVTSTKSRRKPAVAARKPKSNPLNSFARDARRQTWPCTGGGGICNWTQPPR